MPYKLRKAPKRDLYWVVGADGSHKSKEPLPKEQAEAQMRALYAAMGREGEKITGGMIDVEEIRQFVIDNYDEIKDLAEHVYNNRAFYYAMLRRFGGWIRGKWEDVKRFIRERMGRRGAGITIPKDKFIKEHTNLLKVLKKGNPAQLKAEYKDQAKELSKVMRGGGYFKDEARRIFAQKTIGASLSPETRQRAENVLQRALINLKKFGTSYSKDRMSSDDIRNTIADYTRRLYDHARLFPIHGYRYVDQGEVNRMRNWIHDGEETLQKRRDKTKILDELRRQLAILVRSENPRIVPEGSVDAISLEPIKNGDMMYDLDKMYYNPSPNFFRSDGVDEWIKQQRARGEPFINPISGIPVTDIGKYIAQVGPDRPSTFDFKTTPKKTTLQKISGKVAGLFSSAPPPTQEAPARIATSTPPEAEDAPLLAERGAGRMRGGGYFKDEARRIFTEETQGIALSPETLKLTKNVLQRTIAKLAKIGTTHKKEMSDEELENTIVRYRAEIANSQLTGTTESELTELRNWVADAEQIRRKRVEKYAILNAFREQLRGLVTADSVRPIPEGSTDVITMEPIENGEKMVDVDRMYYNPDPNYFKVESMDKWADTQRQMGLTPTNPLTNIPYVDIERYTAQVGPVPPTISFNFKTTPKKTTLQKLSGKVAGLFRRAPPAQEAPAQMQVRAPPEAEDAPLVAEQGAGRRRGGGAMPSRALLQQIAKQSYESSPAPKIDNLTLVSATPTLKFYEAPDNTIVVGIRGTNPTDAQDLKADASIAVGQLESSKRFKSDLAALQNFQSRYSPSTYDYYGVGHSLGGAILDAFLTNGFLKNGVSYNPAVQPQNLRNADIKNERVFAENDPLYALAKPFLARAPEVRKARQKKWWEKLVSAIPYVNKAYDLYSGHQLDNFEGGGSTDFKSQLKAEGMSPASYLKKARSKAKKEGYDPKSLNFATDGVHKLEITSADGKVSRFGRVGYRDLILWLHSESPSVASMHRERFHKSHSKMRGAWKANPYSPNNLALRVLW
jgi:hypothetical protein